MREAMSWRSGLLIGFTYAAACLYGCGLALDYDPPDPQAPSGDFDGGLDAGGHDDGGAARSDGSFDGSAADAFVPDAFVPDAFVIECGDGNACEDDGNPCNGGVECVDGRCVATAPPVCEEIDGIGCTVAICDPELGHCVERAQNTLCDEPESCLTAYCDLELGCQVVPDDGACDDGALCTHDACDPAISRLENGCVHRPDDTACAPFDDGDCRTAVCVGAALADPSRGSGCGFVLDETRCDEGRRCAMFDDRATCVTFAALCEVDGDCDDGNPCNGVEACEEGRCLRRSFGCPSEECRLGYCDVTEGEPVCALRDGPACYPIGTAS